MSAYKAGIDPNAAKWGAIASISNSVAGAAAAIAAPGSKISTGTINSANGNTSASGFSVGSEGGMFSGNMLWILLAGLGLILFKK